MGSVLTVVLIVLPCAIGNVTFYTELLVDQTMAVLFGSIIAYYFTSQDKRSSLWYICPALVMLALMKDAGLGLSLVAAAVIAIDRVVCQLSFSESRRHVWRLISNAWIALVPIGAFALWKVNVALSKIPPKAIAPIAEQLKRMIAGQMEPYQTETLSYFIKGAVASRPFILWPMKVSLLGMVVVLTVAPFIYAFLTKKYSNTDALQFKRVLVSTTVLLLGAIAYTFTTMLMYLTSFSPYEAVRLGGFERYLGSYVWGIVVLDVLLVMYWILRKQCLPLVKYMGIVILLGLVCINGALFKVKSEVIQNARILVETTQEQARPFDAAEVIRPFINTSKDKVCFMSIGSAGTDVYRLRYQLCPPLFKNNVFAEGAWSIGRTTYYSDDPWTRIMTPPEWSEFVVENKFTLIYMFKVDGAFRARYGLMFDVLPVNGSLYRVQPNSQSNLLRLIYTPNR